MQGNESETIKSAKGMMQTPDTRIIVAGGPSSSEILNDFREAIISDVVELDRRNNDLTEQIALANIIYNVGISGISAMVNSLSARIPAASGKFLADFFVQDFVHGTNDAAVSTDYGQVTLPILSTQEKLVGFDSSDRVWIPKSSQVMYSYSTGVPDETDWLTDDKSVFALDQRLDTAWWRNRPTSGTVWVRVKLPANLNANKNSNTIILHPFPPLKFDLVSVEYRNPAGVYSTADLTHLEGWSTTKNIVENFGNVRIFIPQGQVTELRIRINTPDYWGFTKFSVQQIEFSPIATLVCDFSVYSLGSITTITVFGKDQDALSYLITSANGALASVTLTQNTQNSSPIITGVEVQVT